MDTYCNFIAYSQRLPQAKISKRPCAGLVCTVYCVQMMLCRMLCGFCWGIYMESAHVSIQYKDLMLYLETWYLRDIFVLGHQIADAWRKGKNALDQWHDDSHALQHCTGLLINKPYYILCYGAHSQLFFYRTVCFGHLVTEQNLSFLITE